MPAQMHDFLTEDLEALVMRLCTSRSELKERMVGSLRGRGATMVQAEETAEEVITECLRVGGENLLTRFHGKCAVDVWIMRVAINRLVSAQRHEAAMRRRAGRQVVLPCAFEMEDALRDLARRAVRSALAGLPHQWRVLLWLRHGFGISQDRLSKAWRVSPSKISRILSEARSTMKRETLAALAREEPGLVLGWDEICAACSDEELFVR